MLKGFGTKREISKYFSKLPAALSQRYGKSERYTLAQVRKTVTDLGLNQRYIEYAYLAFCGEQMLRDLGKDTQEIEEMSDFLSSQTQVSSDNWLADFTPGDDAFLEGSGLGDSGTGAGDLS